MQARARAAAPMHASPLSDRVHQHTTHCTPRTRARTQEPSACADLLRSFVSLNLPVVAFCLNTVNFVFIISYVAGSVCYHQNRIIPVTSSFDPRPAAQGSNPHGCTFLFLSFSRLDLNPNVLSEIQLTGSFSLQVTFVLLPSTNPSVVQWLALFLSA